MSSVLSRIAALVLVGALALVGVAPLYAVGLDGERESCCTGIHECGMPATAIQCCDSGSAPDAPTLPATTIFKLSPAADLGGPHQAVVLSTAVPSATVFLFGPSRHAGQAPVWLLNATFRI